LDSVKKASSSLNVEVFVVDNDSKDGSIEMVQEKHPEVTLISNKENVGFSKANNQAMEVAQGKYILLLNPDTVVGEETFEKTFEYMENHSETGGLGIRMFDGRGNFLPESKRGLPSPMVAFYKIFGLSVLFPKSKRFGQYHFGHIPEDQTAEIDILSGAFMMMRKEALIKTGFLDETFFMYGEDIDLSYRIQLAGYKNVYYADSSIIHYKGESTKKGSANYVFVFYRAMIIFARKHFSHNNASTYSLLINLAIYLRASLALLVRLVKRLTLPLVDLTLITGGLFALTNYWTKAGIEFPYKIIAYSIPIYALTWVFSNFFQGAYDKPIKLLKFIKGTLLGTLPILLVYGLLPKDYQFSRLFILIGASWTVIYYLLSRIYLHFTIQGKFDLRKRTRNRFLVFSKGNSRLIKEHLKFSHGEIDKIDEMSDFISGKVLDEYDELIYDSSTIHYNEIIEHMGQNRGSNCSFKIAPKEADYFVGSDSIDTKGELYILNINTLLSEENKRKKRTFDWSFALLLLLLLPFNIWTYSNKKKYINNLISILFGNQSFIGFTENTRLKDVRLPKIKPGILHPSDILGIEEESVVEKLNLLYSRDYSMRKDLSIVLKAWKKLDR
jgi:GT2 family glycosyltransferase